MNRQTIKNIMLCAIAAFLALTSFAVIYVDCMLGQVYAEQQKSIIAAAQAAPVPVLKQSATPTASSGPAAATKPSRAPLPGDIVGVRFPDYDTGANAEYSYQSDELRIAVDKVEEDGVTFYVADIWMRNIN